MAANTVTAIRRKPTAQPRLLLTELPKETVHRVACVRKYHANHPRMNGLCEADDDEQCGQVILMRDLAAALDHAQEVGYGL